MAETERLVTLPTSVEANPNDLRLSPNELRALKAETGRTMQDLMGEDADDADRMQAIVWIELRRRGFDASWNDAGDVAIAFTTPEPDPTSGSTSTG